MARTAQEILKQFQITPEQQTQNILGAVRIGEGQQVFTLGTGGGPIESPQQLLSAGFREDQVQSISAEEAQSLGIQVPQQGTQQLQTQPTQQGGLIQQAGQQQVFEQLQGGGLRGIESPQDPRFQELGGFGAVQQISPEAFKQLQSPQPVGEAEEGVVGGGQFDDIQQLLDFFQPKETEQQIQFRESQQATLDRLVGLEQELSQARVSSPELEDLRTQITEQQRVLQDLTPRQFLETTPTAQDVGLTQQALRRRVAAEREPIAAALSDLLFSESILAGREQQAIQNIQAQQQAQANIFGLRGEIQGLRQEPAQLPQSIQAELLRRAFFPEKLSVSEARDLGVPFGTTEEQASELGITPTEPLKLSPDIEEFRQASEFGLIPEGTSFLNYLKIKADAERKATGGGLDAGLITAILSNPALFNTLTPSAKTALLPELVKFGFTPVRALPIKQTEGFASFDSVSGLVDRLDNLLETGVNIGPAISKISRIGGFFGQAGSTESFRNISEDLFRTILKATSGVAASEKEVERLRSFVPKVDDTEAIAERKIVEFRKTLREVEFNSLNRLRASGFDVSGQQAIFDNKLITENSNVNFGELQTQLKEGEGLVINKKTGDIEAITREEYRPTLHLIVE